MTLDRRFRDPSPVPAAASTLAVMLAAAMALASCSDPYDLESGVLDDPAARSGTIYVVYEEVAEFDLLSRSLAGSGVFEEVAAEIAAVVALPSDIETVFTACGEANAFYGDGRVTMCYEYFDLMTAAFLQSSYEPEEVYQAVLGTGAWVYLHELGHALVEQLAIPITGREEDSVDTLATLVLLHGGSATTLLAVADNFAAMARMADGEQGLAFWDLHSVDAQRMYDVACLIYGSDPDAWAFLVSPDILPEARAQTCPDEFWQKSLGWDRLLAPHYRAGGGGGASGEASSSERPPGQ